MSHCHNDIMTSFQVDVLLGSNQHEGLLITQVPHPILPAFHGSIATPFNLYGIFIINLYDDSAISCLASTLPNHDGQLAGLGTTSAPAGRLILILLLYQYRSIKFLRAFFPLHISSYDVTLSICPTSISIPIS